MPSLIHSAPVVSKVDPLQSRSRQDFITTAGNFCRRLGFPRSVGQIYGLLFFSARPLSLDEIAEQLEISKASVSTGARQLSGWGAIRQVWVPGDRRDFFQLAADPASLLMEVYREFFKPRLGVAAERLNAILETLQEDLTGGSLTEQEFRVCRERLERLSRLQGKIQSAAPLIERLL